MKVNPLLPLILGAVWWIAFGAAPAAEPPQHAHTGRTVVVEVAALNQPFMVNRYGSSVPGGQVYALLRDIKFVDSGKSLPNFATISAEISLTANRAKYFGADGSGNVTLKEYKRPRPISLRANVGDVVEVRFVNLLTSTSSATWSAQPFAGFHLTGLNLMPEGGIQNDSSFVGKNANSFASNAAAAQGQGQGASGVQVYRYFAGAEGVFLIYSQADPTSQNEIGSGLFGSITVQPPGAEYYRSQVTRSDLLYATYFLQEGRPLPPNLLLHRPGDVAQPDLWTLTTFESRLQRQPLEAVPVVVRDPAEQVTSGIAASVESKNLVLLRNAVTGALTKRTTSKAAVEQFAKTKQSGDQIPAGFLYAADTGHPLIDYSSTYPAGYQAAMSGDARPDDSPVLRMLYPVAKSILPAASALPGTDASTEVKTGDLFYSLKTISADPTQGYGPAISALDTGSLPPQLIQILQAWGVQPQEGVAVSVVPERSYVSEIAGQTGSIQPPVAFPMRGFVWLVSGLVVNGKRDSSIIIQGQILTDAQGKAVTGGRLFFLETELHLFHTDLTAIITGPQAGRFPLSQESPSFGQVPAEFDRRQPYREFALGYHNPATTVQSFPQFNTGPLVNMISGGNDTFAINYGIAGIGAEILANRLGVGPCGVNGDEVDLKFEEFFLSSWAVGDPAMLVDRPANVPNQAVLAPKTPGNPSNSWKVGTPQTGAEVRAKRVFFPDDPSNVYHSYIRDHVKMRVYNAATVVPHVHHLHAHQWLRSPDSDEGAYLDSQLIIPGSAFSLEMVYGGSGNRNQTVGDSIFHCHFYTHFAKGMWSLWRVHDVFEEGTLLAKDGAVQAPDPNSSDPKLAWVRALPDGEIQNGTPIPAIVPLPTLGMAPNPADVRVTRLPEIVDPAGKNADELKKMVNVAESMGRVAEVKPESRDKAGKPVYKNPGYPFFVPGVAGHRAPHPPLALGWEEEKPGVPKLVDGRRKYLDGGLPRHQVLGGKIVREYHTNWDFTKDFIRYEKENGHETPKDGGLIAYLVPEEGTEIEDAAMKTHEVRTHPTRQPDGAPGQFLHNGLPRVPGAPYADPAVDDNGNFTSSLRQYKAAVIQKDVIFSKQGIHYPQQRIITLWQDVKPTLDNKRPPEPFFFRANGGETIEFWHTNLLPDYYEMDDYQVRTPTDIVGQHIHLVKFDVTASDGAANGFNYEEGTLAPSEVRARIDALEQKWTNSYPRRYGLFAFNHTPNGVPSIDWKKFELPLKVTSWEGSYLQAQMSQGVTIPPTATPEALKNLNVLRPPSGQNWDGAMTTIERFSTDPLLNNQGVDRTVRSVFTHDHFGPSTHQQAGLYGALLVEPAGSRWRDPVTGNLYYDTNFRTDGGPTGWEAIIELPGLEKSYREFALEFQDLSLAYNANSPKALRSIEDVRQQLGLRFSSLFQFAATSPNPPQDKGLVKDYQVTGGTLQQIFASNGIRLDDTATFRLEGTGAAAKIFVLDEKNYNYGAEGPAFRLEGTYPNYEVRTPHLMSWADPANLAPTGKTFDSSASLQIQPVIISQGRPVATTNDSGGGTGLYTLNYRSEPFMFRAPNGLDSTGFASIARNAGLDIQPSLQSPPAVLANLPPLFSRPIDPARINDGWYDPVGVSSGDAGVNNGQISIFDPITPLLRAYQNDTVQVRMLVGGYASPHQLMLHGVKWLGQPMNESSGYRNAQAMGISEHYELLFRMPPATTPHAGPTANDPLSYNFADFLYAPSSGTAGLTFGVWGLLRSFDPPAAPLQTNPVFPPTLTTPPFPANQPRASLQLLPKAANPRFSAGQPGHQPVTFKYPAAADVEFDITASATPLVFNDANYRAGSTPLTDPNGMLFAVTAVYEKGSQTPVAGATTQAGDPLILRVRAGQWVKINLTNTMPAGGPTPQRASDASLHPSLVGYDVTNADGANVGFNPKQSVPGVAAGGQPAKRTYWWYAGEFITKANGDLDVDASGVPKGRPVEFGAINLLPPGYLTQTGRGLVGALVVEPENSTWAPAQYLSAQATITPPAGRPFKECVLIQQNNVTAGNAVNLRSEPASYRPAVTAGNRASFLSNSLVGGNDPKTPVFGDEQKFGAIFAGDAVRFRVVRPGGEITAGNIMFELHGHAWQQEPWTEGSLSLGENPGTQTLGAEILGPFEALNILIDSAGGPEKVPGDYLYQNYPSPGQGGWGILRVKPAPATGANP